MTLNHYRKKHQYSVECGADHPYDSLCNDMIPKYDERSEGFLERVNEEVVQVETVNTCDGTTSNRFLTKGLSTILRLQGYN